MADLKTVIVSVKGLPDQVKQDRITITTAIAVGGLGMEGMVANICIVRPGDGKFGEQQQCIAVGFTPSKELDALMLSEANAAIAKAAL